MSNISAVASSPPVTGITRDCDLVLVGSSGSRDIGQPCSQVMNLRTGVQGGVNANTVVQSSATWQLRNGMTVPAVSSGLGNGAAIIYGINVQTDPVLAAANPSAYATRRGVSRVISTMSADTAETPNNDVGMQCVIGGSTLAQLLPVTGGGAGKVGFGIWMLGGLWKWAMKVAADAANTVSDQVTLQSGGVNLDVTAPNLIELRIYDSAGGVASASHNARVEVWVNSILFLTRYWSNPVGIATQALPPMIDPFYPQIRNTSTGPAKAYFGDFCLIHGPANEGTLSDA